MMFPPHPKYPNMIRANPLLETYQMLFVLWFIVIGLMLVMFIGGIVISVIVRPGSDELTKLLSFVSLYGLLFLGFITSFVTTITQRRYWQRIERRRLAAAGGDPSLLASEQSIANLAALQLPCKIEVRMGNGAILLLIAMSLVFALVFSSVSSWLNDGFLFISPDRFHNFLVLFSIFGGSMVIVLLALFLSPVGLGRQKVEVTEQGLRVRYGGKRSVMRWEEVRLFAMYNTYSMQKNGSTITYELSSATDIARWAWVLRPNSLHIQMVPTGPFEEYTRQMQALCALIVARTGLPLYDLRQEPVVRISDHLPGKSMSNS
ncbi:MAG: hypothetical protein ACYDER_17940 [Ktedonobacteraceae bacterium]